MTDKDGGTSTVSGGTLVVYDPGAGSVAGLGALIDGRELVLFKFDAAYRGRDATPSGNVELHAPHLTLLTTQLDWLVVAPPSFELQGTARVDGRNGYRFRLDGVTGRPDKLRVEVWSPAGALLYDSSLLQVRVGDIAIRRP